MATGEYDSESDLISRGLEALKDEYEERRRYEQEVVGPAHDELMADLSLAIPLEQVERDLATARLQRLKAS
jgi:Arc/MetJ-type ribon-helix-helix transcriptional regulator